MLQHMRGCSRHGRRFKIGLLTIKNIQSETIWSCYKKQKTCHIHVEENFDNMVAKVKEASPRNKYTQSWVLTNLIAVTKATKQEVIQGSPCGQRVKNQCITGKICLERYHKFWKIAMKQFFPK